MIDVAIPQSVLGIFLKDEYNKEFLYYTFLKKEKWFKKMAETGSQPNLSLQTIQNLPILLPSLQEQQKIAHFFSLLDKQIQLWERKLELYELKRKYYLNILLEVVNNLPKWRFKEFNDEWERKKLIDICIKMKSGGTPKADNPDFYNGNIPFLSISDFSSKYLYKTSKFINDLALSNSSSYVVKKNNIILSIYATIGKPIINMIDVAIPQSVLGIFLKDKYNKDFVYYTFLKKERWFIKMSETGSQPNLSLQTIQTFSLFVPSSDEQEKVSKFFSLIDKQIGYFKFEKELLKKIKKYYINNLFI